MVKKYYQSGFNFCLVVWFICVAVLVPHFEQKIQSCLSGYGVSAIEWSDGRSVPSCSDWSNWFQLDQPLDYNDLKAFDRLKLRLRQSRQLGYNLASRRLFVDLQDPFAVQSKSNALLVGQAVFQQIDLVLALLLSEQLREQAKLSLLQAEVVSRWILWADFNVESILDPRSGFASTHDPLKSIQSEFEDMSFAEYCFRSRISTYHISACHRNSRMNQSIKMNPWSQLQPLTLALQQMTQRASRKEQTTFQNFRRHLVNSRTHSKDKINQSDRVPPENLNEWAYEEIRELFKKNSVDPKDFTISFQNLIHQHQSAVRLIGFEHLSHNEFETFLFDQNLISSAREKKVMLEYDGKFWTPGKSLPTKKEKRANEVVILYFCRDQSGLEDHALNYSELEEAMMIQIINGCLNPRSPHLLSSVIGEGASQALENRHLKIYNTNWARYRKWHTDADYASVVQTILDQALGDRGHDPKIEHLYNWGLFNASFNLKIRN